MAFSASSLLTCNFFIILFSIFLHWLRRKGCYLRINLTILIVSLLAVVLRLSIPLELPFAKTLFTTRLVPLMHFLYSDYSFRSISFTPWHLFLWVWAAGAAVNGILFLWKCYRFSCFQKQIGHFDDPVLAAVSGRLSKEDKPLSKYRFYQLPCGTSPCCTGLFRHRIYLPASTYTEDELYYVLRHELAHCSNHDLILKGVLELFRIVQWWNPLICWLKNNVYQLCEIRADACAVHGFNERQLSEYAECLLKSARLSPITLHQVQTSVHEGNSSVLKTRCQLILHTNTANDSSPKNTISFCIVAVLLWFLSLFCVINSYSGAVPDADRNVFYAEEEMYAICTENGYELFMNHELMGILDTLPSSMSIPVYSTESEVPQ